MTLFFEVLFIKNSHFKKGYASIVLSLNNLCPKVSLKIRFVCYFLAVAITHRRHFLFNLVVLFKSLVECIFITRSKKDVG